MTLYLAVADPPVVVDESLRGPWVDLRPVQGGAVLIESDDTLSRVYHELKWSLPADSSLLVTEVAAAKMKYQAAGLASWTQSRLPRPG